MAKKAHAACSGSLRGRTNAVLAPYSGRFQHHAQRLRCSAFMRLCRKSVPPCGLRSWQYVARPEHGRGGAFASGTVSVEPLGRADTAVAHTPRGLVIRARSARPERP